jgi:anti-sigma factor RsiW
MREDHVRDELALFVDGSLAAEAAASVAAHLAGCAACAAEAAAIRALLAGVAAARPDEQRPDLGDRHWQALARDIHAAVDALPAPGRPWWRRRFAWAGAGGLALAAVAAAALLAARPAPAPAPPGTPVAAPTLQEVVDEELALGKPGAAEEALDELELDDAALARLEAEL